MAWDNFLLGFAAAAMVLAPPAFAQSGDTARAEQSTGRPYAALTGITELTLAAKLPGDAAPVKISEAEVIELASKRISEASIRLVKSGNETSPEMALLIEITDRPWNCRKPELLPNSDLVIGGACIGGPSVSLTVRKRGTRPGESIPARRSVWGRGVGGAMAGYPAPDTDERVRLYLDQLLTDFIKDFRAANPKPE